MTKEIYFKTKHYRQLFIYLNEVVNLLTKNLSDIDNSKNILAPSVFGNKLYTRKI